LRRPAVPFFADRGFFTPFFVAVVAFALLDVGEATIFLAIFDLATDFSASAFKDRRPAAPFIRAADVDAPLKVLPDGAFPVGEEGFVDAAGFAVDFELTNLGSFEDVAVPFLFVATGDS